VSVCLSVCLTATLLYRIRKIKDIIRLFLRQVTPIILVFFPAQVPLHNCKGNPLLGGVKYCFGGKVRNFPPISRTIWQTRQGNGCHGTLTESQRYRIDRCQFRCGLLLCASICVVLRRQLFCAEFIDAICQRRHQYRLHTTAAAAATAIHNFVDGAVAQAELCTGIQRFPQIFTDAAASSRTRNCSTLCLENFSPLIVYNLKKAEPMFIILCKQYPDHSRLYPVMLNEAKTSGPRPKGRTV